MNPTSVNIPKLFPVKKIQVGFFFNQTVNIRAFYASSFQLDFTGILKPPGTHSAETTLWSIQNPPGHLDDL